MVCWKCKGGFMSTEKMGFDPQYDDNKTSGVLYVGKDIKKPDGTSFRKMEVIIDQEENYLSEKNREQESTPIGFSIKDDIVLFLSNRGQQKIHCWLMESNEGKSINAISISRRTEKGVYGSQEITLPFPAAAILKKYLDNLFCIDTTNKSKFSIQISELISPIQSSSSQIISEEEFAELMRANISSTDDFYKLISLQKMEIAINRLEEIIRGDYKNEVEIQKFLKDNIWMFGNDYVFIVQDNKINTGNILDMIPQNLESYVDIIEVKLPNEKLFNIDSSHQNFYPTANLTKAIAQTQNYIFEFENKTHDNMYQQMNNCIIIKPRGIILYGSEQDLIDEEKKYLRILNASYHNIQIITYQQLLEKARNTIAFSKRM